MTAHRILAIASCVVALVGTTYATASAWPKYAGQVLHKQSGVLTAFTNGNKAGGLAIRLKDGTTRDFATFHGTTWNRRKINCYMLPSRVTPCADWPKSILAMKTIVVVTYWDDVLREPPGIPGPIRVATDISPG